MGDPAAWERARENLTGIVSMLVTGIWLAAMFLGFEWWLPFMLFGYIALVPLTAILFGDEDDVEEWVDHDVTTGGDAAESTAASREGAANDAALARLRERYANGELTDEQFERKVERLLETDSLEDVEDRHRHRNREQGREHGTGRERKHGRERETEFE